MKKQYLLQIIYVLLSVLFLYTALSKLLDFRHFVSDMNGQPLPDLIKPALVWIIPLTEILIVTAFFFNRTRVVGLYAAFFLLAAFTAYTTMVMLRAFDRVPCSCGGFIRTLTWPQHLAFNMLFLALAGMGLWMEHTRHRTNQPGKIYSLPA